MASIDSILSDVQQFAEDAALEATNLMREAVAAAGSFTDVGAITLADPDNIDPLPDQVVQPFTATLNGPNLDGWGLSGNVDNWIVNRDAVSKAYLEAGMQDWLTAFAPLQASKLAELEAKISDGLTSGSAMSAAVEQAIYTRARDRIDAENSAAQTQVSATMAKRGFPLPPGVLTAALRQITKDSADRIAQSATETAIEKAKQEIQHIQFCVQNALSLRQSIHGNILQYAGIIGTVHSYTLTYVDAMVKAMVAEIEARLKVALANYDADKTEFEAAVKEVEMTMELKVKQLEGNLQRARLLLDKSVEQGQIDLQIAIKNAELAQHNVDTVTQAASEGAKVQGEMAAAALSAQNTLVSADDAA